MRGVYGHVTPAMRAGLTAMLRQQRWVESLREWARLATCSIVPGLDALLAVHREPAGKIGSHFGPQNRTPAGATSLGEESRWPLSWGNSGRGGRI